MPQQSLQYAWRCQLQPTLEESPYPAPFQACQTPPHLKCTASGKLGPPMTHGTGLSVWLVSSTGLPSFITGCPVFLSRCTATKPAHDLQHSCDQNGDLPTCRLPIRLSISTA